MIATIGVAVVLVWLTWTVVTLRRNPRRFGLEWQKGERWIRIFPNPGFRLTEEIWWSKHWGWGSPAKRRARQHRK